MQLYHKRWWRTYSAGSDCPTASRTKFTEATQRWNTRLLKICQRDWKWDGNEIIRHSWVTLPFCTFLCVGALCRAAYDGSNPNLVLAESVPTLWQMENAEIESIMSFFKGIGCEVINLSQRHCHCVFMQHAAKLCDYITNDNGETQQPEKSAPSSSKTAYQWPKQKLSKVEIQGFLSTAKKIGSMCSHSFIT